MLEDGLRIDRERIARNADHIRVVQIAACVVATSMYSTESEVDIHLCVRQTLEGVGANGEVAHRHQRSDGT